MAVPDAERTIEQPNGRRARVLGRAQRGGLRIDGGEGGFAERTVTRIDLAWVIAADEHKLAEGSHRTSLRKSTL